MNETQPNPELFALLLTYLKHMTDSPSSSELHQVYTDLCLFN